jgi:hypothetical protein
VSLGEAITFIVDKLFNLIYAKPIMANKKSTHPFHMPVPTKIGFAIIGMAVMVYGLFLASSVTSNMQTQNTQTEAAGICPRPGPSCPRYYYLACTNGGWRCLRLPSCTIVKCSWTTPANSCYTNNSSGTCTYIGPSPCTPHYAYSVHRTINNCTGSYICKSGVCKHQ